MAARRVDRLRTITRDADLESAERSLLASQVWACVHILLSVAMVGEVISSYDTVRDERKAVLARIMQASGRLVVLAVSCSRPLAPYSLTLGAAAWTH